ncbi:MAG: hypothetical protein ACO24Y_05005 [Hylemonella sp.]
MEFFLALLLLLVGGQYAKGRDQRQRIALLSRHLGNYPIERLMQTLTEGYLQALEQADKEARDQAWSRLAEAEAELCGHLSRFVQEFSQVWSDRTQVSTLPLALPFGTKLFPRQAFDLRQALAIHARGIAQTVENQEQRAPKDKAFTMTAELLLMQHSCHWYCRSRAVATARMLARHQTHYAQLLQAVSPATRQAYGDLLAGRVAAGV